MTPNLTFIVIDKHTLCTSQTWEIQHRPTTCVEVGHPLVRHSHSQKSVNTVLEIILSICLLSSSTYCPRLWSSFNPHPCGHTGSLSDDILLHVDSRCLCLFSGRSLTLYVFLDCDSRLPSFSLADLVLSYAGTLQHSACYGMHCWSIHITWPTKQSAFIGDGVARECMGFWVHPQGDKKFFSRHFCWNESKMGLNLVRCTPADETKR